MIMPWSRCLNISLRLLEFFFNAKTLSNNEEKNVLYLYIFTGGIWFSRPLPSSCNFSLVHFWCAGSNVCFRLAIAWLLPISPIHDARRRAAVAQSLICTGTHGSHGPTASWRVVSTADMAPGPGYAVLFHVEAVRCLLLTRGSLCPLTEGWL